MLFLAQLAGKKKQTKDVGFMDKMVFLPLKDYNYQFLHKFEVENKRSVEKINEKK